jgi:hypothetical protein
MDQGSQGPRDRAQPLTPEEAERASAEGRPAPNPVPPACDADVKTLRWLLRIEKRRLKEAVRIERERRVVFPETSVILRDVCRLVDAIAAREGRIPPRGAAPDQSVPFEGQGSNGERAAGDYDDFLKSLG